MHHFPTIADAAGTLVSDLCPKSCNTCEEGIECMDLCDGRRMLFVVAAAAAA